MGDGLVTEINHEKWKARRALFNPGFHRQLVFCHFKNSFKIYWN